MIIFHVDANSAYLSWSAARMLEEGYPVDIRTIPAVIAGDPEKRHGIILAKSGPAKRFGIKTGESLMEARRKCPELAVFPPNYDQYLLCSDEMHRILSEYSSRVERYSVDECFLDYTASEKKFGPPEQAASEIGRRMREELGFTVNIGISVNKLLAKMGSELEKPDRVHTLYPEEMKEKLWPLPVSELFMVGRATAAKLRAININTIGDLAAAEPLHMKALLKSHGELVWNYANGRDVSPVTPENEILQKGLGNSTTMSYDVVDRREAHMILLALTERMSMRLRRMGRKTSLAAVSVKTGGFCRYQHQVQLQSQIDSTTELYGLMKHLFDACWKGEPIRHLGVSAGDLSDGSMCQQSLFRSGGFELGRLGTGGPPELSRFIEPDGRLERLDRAVDQLRRRFGEQAVSRGCFVNGGIPPIQGGTNEGNYIMIGGYRS